MWAIKSKTKVYQLFGSLGLFRLFHIIFHNLAFSIKDIFWLVLDIFDYHEDLILNFNLLEEEKQEKQVEIKRR